VEKKALENSICANLIGPQWPNGCPFQSLLGRHLAPNQHFSSIVE
jgi:hypothetical protein